MNAVLQPPRFADAEAYLAWEELQTEKHEYVGGEVWAMTGARGTHNLIAGNIFGELRQQFKDRKCEVYQSDMRVKVNATGLHTYPDVVATCDEPRFEDNQVDTLVNPKVIVVLAGTNNVGREPGDDAKVADITRGIAASCSYPSFEPRRRRSSAAAASPAAIAPAEVPPIPARVNRPRMTSIAGG